MSDSPQAKISFFSKYLSLWVALCIGLGVAIGFFLPGLPRFLGNFEYAHVSIPVAILIWLMFSSVVSVHHTIDRKSVV